MADWHNRMIREGWYKKDGLWTHHDPLMTWLDRGEQVSVFSVLPEPTAARLEKNNLTVDEVLLKAGVGE